MITFDYLRFQKTQETNTGVPILKSLRGTLFIISMWKKQPLGRGERAKEVKDFFSSGNGQVKNNNNDGNQSLGLLYWP